MIDERQYKINLDDISESFKFTEKGLTHRQGNKFKLLPYAANEKTLVSDLTGVVGSFSRCISGKELKGEFNLDMFIDDVADKVGTYEGAANREVFKDIVRSMFIEDENLVDFDIKTINYIASTSAD
ncbi:MAG: DNA phosphorothioation-dependent restriction protein DptG, partial [Anaeroplasmataceae bacterium]